jgi:hypothetical protein
MHNALQPHVKLTIGGVEYRLVFDLDAVAEAEDILDRALITGLTQQDVFRPKVSLVRAMLFAVLRREQPKLTYDEVKQIVTRANLTEVWTKVFEAWCQSNPEPEQDNSDEDPTPAQR